MLKGKKFPYIAWKMRVAFCMVEEDSPGVSNSTKQMKTASFRWVKAHLHPSPRDLQLDCFAAEQKIQAIPKEGKGL